MADLGNLIAAAVETPLRMLPVPRRTGIIRIGSPDRQSPVLLTGNYDLTVRRVLRALRGQACYLLVANSRGVNVWCSSCGGLFTHHDVVSALKTSGIADLVDDREVILPQLAAAGVEANEVEERSGWRVRWGPVDARDLPAFLRSPANTTPTTRQVAFGLASRLEMAVAWAFPVSALTALVLLFVWRAALLPVLLLVWALSLLLFAAFPGYAGLLVPRGNRPGRRSFGLVGLQGALWGCLLLGLALGLWVAGTFSWGLLIRWAIAALAVVVLISIDLPGSTPVLKSSFYPDRFLTIALDAALCTLCGTCTRVCPRGCYRLDPRAAAITISDPERCVQCGACIVQCPTDALSFHSPNGAAISPQAVRSHKLDMMGHRTKAVR
jgi:NAD-dependent dihydropyrimidine dehydrogenase PreA subunit